MHTTHPGAQPPTDPVAPPGPKPIFTDESGRRATVVQWLARGVCGASLVVAGAVAFTLTTHVPLPGLDRILSPHRSPEAGLTIRADRAAGSTLGVGLGLGSDRSAASVTMRTSVPAVLSIARTGMAVAAESVPASDRSEASTPVAAPTAASTPDPPASTTGHANPHASAKGANSGNAHAAAQGTNSSARATPRPTKSADPRATAAKTKAKPSGDPSKAPPRSKKK